MTVQTNYVVATTPSAPYSTTATSTGNVGDVLICSAASYEFSSASPGSRTLAMATAGWTQLNLEELQVYPTFPVYANRRTHLAAWWKIATSTSDTVTVTLSGASEALRDPLANLTASSASTTVRTAILNQRAALDALLAASETP